MVRAVFGGLIKFAEMLMIWWSEMRQDTETLSVTSSSACVMTRSIVWPNPWGFSLRCCMVSNWPGFGLVLGDDHVDQLMSRWTQRTPLRKHYFWHHFKAIPSYCSHASSFTASTWSIPKDIFRMSKIIDSHLVRFSSSEPILCQSNNVYICTSLM